MKVSVYCDDIRTLLIKLENQEKPLEWIYTAKDVIKVCQNIIDLATETALNFDKQPELNI